MTRPPDAALACPACGRALVSGTTAWACTAGHGPFPVTPAGVSLVTPERHREAAVLAAAFAAWWENAGPRHPLERARMHAQLARVAGAGNGRVACDVGAGNGDLTRRLGEDGWRVFALDLVPSAPPSPDARAVGALLDAPPFAPGTLDLVVMSASLQYAPDPAPVLAAWARALAPKGRLLVALTPMHRTTRGAERGAATTRRVMRAAGAVALAERYAHLTRDAFADAVRDAGLVVRRTRRPAFTLRFRVTRFAKNLALGGDLARFPVLELGHASEGRNANL